MRQKDDDFLKKLLSTFKIEAREHINVMSSGLIELEKSSSDERRMEIIETIFREAHSLKGAARAVNMTDMEALCQSLESVFSALKRKDMALSPRLFDLLYRSVDDLEKLLSSTDAEQAASHRSQIPELIQSLESALKGLVEPPRQETLKEAEEEHPIVPESETYRPWAEGKPMVAETVRISTAKLDSILHQAEELRSAKLAAGQRATELRQINKILAAWDKAWAKILPDVRTLQRSFETNGEDDGNQNGRRKKNSQMIKFIEFLEWNATFVKSLENEVMALAKSAEHHQRSLGAMVDNLLEDIKKVLMLPFSSLLEIFPRAVRELSHDQGKDVELVIRGGEVEVDRRILEEIKDPLIHIVRNCIDHGIEKPEQREQKRKPACGTVTIAVSQKDGGKVEILISDDGVGIDVVKLKAAAVKLGILSQEQAEKLNQSEALSLIFQSGVSTSPIITDLSGRGLGLAIVWERVEKLGGTVFVETHPHAGTMFRIILPVTLTTSRGLLVRVDEHLFVLPTMSIESVLKVNREEIKTVENRETIRLNGQAVSLVNLSDVLELPRKSAPSDPSYSLHVVVLASGEKRIAFLLDEILNEQDVLVKPLGKQLSRVRNIAGATILGTGKAVPILNPLDLMKSAVRANVAIPKSETAPLERDQTKRKSVLVVEDSITARMLLKNILEAEGYDVKTAIDGVDAFTQLRTGEFDIVISDVEMPRMNGFELTSKIRTDKKLAELPVVLVTALESREDRERGIDVGANGYIVKSSFDQSNLLAVIRRLV